MSTGFRNAPLEDAVAVGAVTHASVRLWLRSRSPGRVVARVWPDGRDAQAVLVRGEVPEDDERDGTRTLLVGAPDATLAPSTRHRFSIHHEDGHEIGSGRFTTAPSGPSDAPDDLAIGFLSCHQPFDRDGTPNARSAAMLRAARAAFEEHDVRLVLMMGDQMYTDFPAPLSLLSRAYFPRVAPPGRETVVDCTPREVRRLLQMRYRHFGALPEWRALLERFPCHPILDDHELVDNWGSAPEHEQKAWQNVLRGARLAYRDYQGSRVEDAGDALPDAFDQEIDYGDVSVYVLDLRSNRRVVPDARVVSPGQLGHFARFLAERGDRSAIFVVLSVPLIHLPRRAAKAMASVTRSGEDFSDRWSTVGHVVDRDRMLRILHDHQQRHPHQVVSLLSGDIHISCAHEIQWRSGVTPLVQAVSSGITHCVSRAVALASGWVIRSNRRIVTEDGALDARIRRLPGEALLDANPYGRLNLGIVRCEREPGRPGRAVRFLVYGHDGDAPRLVYRSLPIRRAAPG